MTFSTMSQILPMPGLDSWYVLYKLAIYSVIGAYIHTVQMGTAVTVEKGN